MKMSDNWGEVLFIDVHAPHFVQPAALDRRHGRGERGGVVRHPGGANVKDRGAGLNGLLVVVCQGRYRALVDVVHKTRHHVELGILRGASNTTSEARGKSGVLVMLS